MIDIDNLPAGLDELKMRFEVMVGFNTFVTVDKYDRVKLNVQAPFGHLLGSIDVSHYDGVWAFAGSSSFMPESWNKLCDLKAKDP